MVRETSYTKSGGVHIAFQVAGEGPFDVAFVPGFISNLDLKWWGPRGRVVPPQAIRASSVRQARHWPSAFRPPGPTTSSAVNSDLAQLDFLLISRDVPMNSAMTVPSSSITVAS